jgi:hypothetical protein
MLLKKIFIVLSATALVAACGGGTPTPSDPAVYSEVSYKVIVSSMPSNSQQVNWQTAAVANATDWMIFWKTTYGDSATPPNVDFSKNNVVGAQLLGSNGCKSVQINEVSQNHQNTQVKYSYKYPINVGCTQAFIDLTTFLTVPKQGDGLASVSFIRDKDITYTVSR